MAKTTTINKVIEEFNYLDLENKEYVIELMKKQMIDTKREQIAHRAKRAMRNLKKGLVKEGSVDDLYEDLERRPIYFQIKNT